MKWSCLLWVVRECQYWLVVWNILIFPIILGMLSPQLTHSFQRGSYTTNQSNLLFSWNVMGYQISRGFHQEQHVMSSYFTKKYMVISWDLINGNFRIQLMEVRKRTTFLAIFSGDIPWNFGLKNSNPKTIWNRYLQFRNLKWPVISWGNTGMRIFGSHRGWRGGTQWFSRIGCPIPSTGWSSLQNKTIVTYCNSSSIFRESPLSLVGLFHGKSQTNSWIITGGTQFCLTKNNVG